MSRKFFGIKRRGETNAFMIVSIAVLVLSFLIAVRVNTQKIREQELNASPAQVAAFQDEMLMATLWMQRSAEYHALCYQAYNIALDRISRAVAVRRSGLGAYDQDSKPFALVLDLDETVLDNSPMAVRRFGSGPNANIPFNKENWAAWSAIDQVEALPGAVKFLQTVDRLGVQIFYVTNRLQDCQEGVVKSLTRLGFPQLEPEHLLFCSDTGDKKPRFEQVAQNFDVLVYLGDNLGDMNLDSYGTDSDTRVAIADSNAQKFGMTRIVLPNPVYGDWENSLAEDYSSLPLTKQDQIRRASLKPWEINLTTAPVSQ